VEKIKTEAEFNKVLLLDKAIVFIFFEWSGQAHVSKTALNNWENQSKFEIPLFELNPEDSEVFSKWICDDVEDVHGYGSIVWLGNGEILNFEKDAGKSGIFQIETKTAITFAD